MESSSKQLIIHIGYPKTGSSFIQGGLQRIVEEIAQEGFWFSGHVQHSHRIAAEFIIADALRDRPDVVAIREQFPLQVAEDLLREFLASEHRVGIITSEYFSIASSLHVIEYFRGLGFSDIRVLAYVRRQDKYLFSGYNQAVKATGETAPLVWQGYDRNLDWFYLVEQWASLVGSARIRLLSYEREVRAGLIESFLRAIGVSDTLVASISARVADIAAELDKNTSLPAPLLELKRLSNLFSGVDVASQYDFLIKHISSREEFSLSREVVVKIIYTYKLSNEKLFETYFDGKDVFDTHLIGTSTSIRDMREDDEMIPTRLLTLFLLNTLSQMQERITALEATNAQLLQQQGAEDEGPGPA
jgi:hypothetical protein